MLIPAVDDARVLADSGLDQPDHQRAEQGQE